MLVTLRTACCRKDDVLWPCLIQAESSQMPCSTISLITDFRMKCFLFCLVQGSWTQAFTNKLNSRVKLVGPIMSCFPVAGTEALHAELGAPTGSLPFLHPSMFATDQASIFCIPDLSCLFQILHPDPVYSWLMISFIIHPCMMATNQASHACFSDL